MRKVLGLVGATLLFAGPALAADLAVKAPTLMPAFSWTGCYIGADVGGALSQQHASITPVGVKQGSVSGDLTGSSAIGGPYVGCNYQFMPAWVVGIEGDYSWAKLSSSTNVRNPSQCGHRFRTESGPPIRSKAATDSERSRPPLLMG
jgi:outer membrane immunogenic protein